MASTTSNIPSEQESRSEVDPLPLKCGEIGYVEGVHGQDDVERSRTPEIVLPARHPADRGSPPIVEAASSGSTPNSRNTHISPPSSTIVDNTETNAKKKRILGFLQPEKEPIFGGVCLRTLLAIVFHILLVFATIAGWVLAVTSKSQLKQDGRAPSPIVIHIIFAGLLVAVLFLLERRVFSLRAERYNYLHPDEILPSSRRVSDPIIAFSPWNRPPLPTYAAALAQSGVGTGDVEDHLTAVLPPPVYGNTRGSTLILAGLARNSLRAQRPFSERSQPSMRDERPLSYLSKDEEWEEVQNAERAQRLEETLARLERPGTRS